MEKNKIGYLLKKYKSSHVKGELHSSQTNNLIKQNQRRLEKHAICDELLNEFDMINFSVSQKEFIHYLVDRFSEDFKKLHHRAKKEAIILVFMFYVKKIEDPQINLNNYSICKKYGLNDRVFKLVICRMCDDFIKKSPIVIQDSTKYDHEILSKNGGKI